MNTTKSYSHKANIKEGSLEPINLCIKFKPPSLALYYRLAGDPGKKFMHSVNIDKEVKAKKTADEIYKELLVNEPMYWNPNNITKEQIIRVIEKLLDNQSIIIASRQKKNSLSKEEEKLTVANTDCTSPILGDSIDNINMNQMSIKKFQSEENPQHKEQAEYNDINPFTVSLNDSKEGEYDSMMKNKIYEEMFKSRELQKERDSITEEDDEKYFSGFQRVYVEELKKEVFMDNAGNLYDMEGSIIGQADLDN